MSNSIQKLKLKQSLINKLTDIAHMIGVSDVDDILTLEGNPVNRSRLLIANSITTEGENKENKEYLEMLQRAYKRRDVFSDTEPNIYNAGWNEPRAHAVSLAVDGNFLIYANTGALADSQEQQGVFAIPLSNSEKEQFKKLFGEEDQLTCEKPSDFFNSIEKVIGKKINILKHGSMNLSSEEEDAGDNLFLFEQKKAQKRGNCSLSNHKKLAHYLILLHEFKKTNGRSPENIKELNGFYTEELKKKILIKYKHFTHEKIRKKGFDMLYEVLGKISEHPSEYSTDLLQITAWFCAKFLDEQKTLIKNRSSKKQQFFETASVALRSFIQEKTPPEFREMFTQREEIFKLVSKIKSHTFSCDQQNEKHLLKIIRVAEQNGFSFVDQAIFAENVKAIDIFTRLGHKNSLSLLQERSAGKMDCKKLSIMVLTAELIGVDIGSIIKPALNFRTLLKICEEGDDGVMLVYKLLARAKRNKINVNMNEKGPWNEGGKEGGTLLDYAIMINNIFLASSIPSFK